MKVLIIGGVAGGASAAARLRRLDENAQIIMFERGEYISFANCGLPYYIGGEITDKSDLTLQSPASFKARFNIDVRINSEVLSINRGEKTVTVKDIINNTQYTESYDKLVLSPGAKPMIPNIDGVGADNVFTLRNIPDTYKIKDYIDSNAPKTATIIGGGFIGLEMAENLNAQGIKVTIFEAAPYIATVIDEDMACDLTHYIRSRGVNVVTNKVVKSLGELDADMVIISVGVKPESELAVNSGLLVNDKGAIVVSDTMLTSDNDIYAVGDAIAIKNYIAQADGYIPLAGPANKQGRICADNICGIKRVYNGTQGTSVLKIFDMTVAATGLNERAIKALKYDYDKVFLWSNSHASYYPSATNMSIKVLYNIADGKILGAQIVGFDGVDKRIDVLATAIRGGMTAYDLTQLELAYAPPFSSAKDPVNMAGFMIENLLTDKIKQYHYSDVEALLCREDITLLDVRTKKEYSMGHIEGTTNIPVDSLRDNMDSLDKSLPIYVNCQSGLRSYIACRILIQNGFDAVNLAGGYRLYASVMKLKGYDKEVTHPCGVKI